MSSRYDGKPFLRLLDSYVLDAIGQLADQQHDSLDAMQPRLQEIYSEPGSWQQIVAAQMDFPETFPAQVKQIWANYLASAKEQGLSVDPNEFVERFVDENFFDSEEL